LTAIGVRLLYDRRIPPGSGKIKHIAVAHSGVWVIDTRRYRVRPSLRSTSSGDTLAVGRRDGTRVVNAMHRRLDIVREVVGPAVPVTGIICFLDADWPLIGGSFTASDIVVAWPKKACDVIRSGRGLTDSQIISIHQHLSAALPLA
jgi:hypothetical protein